MISEKQNKHKQIILNFPSNLMKIDNSNRTDRFGHFNIS